MRLGSLTVRRASLGLLLALALAEGAPAAVPGRPTFDRALFDRSAPDRDRDGYPDAAELRGEDRARFSEWFAAIAESQYYGVSADWAPQDRDCAGLLRYAFVQALLPHDGAWRAKFKYLPPPRLPSVQNLAYPLPYLSRSVFRVAGGAYQAGDVAAGRLVGRTSAQYLANFSARRLGRDPRAARRGDLLFFLRPGLGAYHSMVYLGGGLVVYHTGAAPEEGGEVRLLSLDTLMKHPDPAFHPTAKNPNFLGVYRWKVLD
ncbi:hypothetical protein SAMN04488058_10945 [Deinococcus reticulitermitis]|uniref:DUF1175 domain-containing protein n=1 Tax=Deinococcus reticulitermitis TaxID=856736 RepID=A0A1H6Z684_9DEIO|nr:DUF1175 family protein [Deinococcus reticulitermitis]SEJ49073.1 hypothetical protein SAMN04488058_10945 [Deinococcus reticulitermitis]